MSFNIMALADVLNVFTKKPLAARLDSKGCGAQD